MKNRALQTQIIGGKYKGIKLDLPELATTRSTKSIIRESVFNTLAHDIVDSVFIEVFGGSGSMAIEALSRGAKEVYAIEIDKQAFKVLLENKRKIDQNTCTFILGDTFKEVPKIIENISQNIYLYFDPPFSYRENMEDIYKKSFELLQTIPAQKVALAIYEHMSILETPNIIGNFQKIKTKKFGKSSLSYYT